MKKVAITFLVGAVLLVVGFVWAFTMNGLGTLEWVLLLTGVGLGILAGMVQGWAVARKNQGRISGRRMRLWISGAIIVLIAIKVAINILIPSYLATNENGIYLSIVFAIGGLLLGRYLYARLVPVSGELSRKLS